MWPKITVFCELNKVRSDECLNEKIIKSDDLLVNKIIDILEGNQNMSETLKFEKTKEENVYLFKIQLNIKNGISLLIFCAKLERSVITDFKIILIYSSYFFKKKLEVKDELKREYSENSNLAESTVTKLISLNLEIEGAKEKLLTKVYNFVYLSSLNC